MGEHVNTKKDPLKHHKRGFSENLDAFAQRKQRMTFKGYIQQLEDDLLEQELVSEEWVVRQRVKLNENSYHWVDVAAFPTEEEALERLYEEQELSDDDFEIHKS